MLVAAGKKAKLVATKPGTLDQVAPVSYEYGSQSPLAERIQPFEDYSLGFGLSRQSAWIDRKYRYTIHADASVSGQVTKGPKITTLTPATTDSTSGVIDLFAIGGSVFSLNGRYVHKRISDLSWTLVKDFGVGKAATDVVVFTTNALEPGVTYAYIAMGDAENIYRFDGTTFEQHASLKATHFCVVGRDIYRSLNINMAAKCSTDADPWTAANWTSENAFRIGDKSSAIVNLAATPLQQLLIFKTDGVYSLDGSTGEDVPLFDGLRFAPDPDNGKFVGSFLDNIHVTYGGIHYKLTPVSELGSIHYEIDPIGPERMLENDSIVRGQVTAFTAVEGLYALAGLCDRDTGNTHLMKFSSYIGSSIAEGKLEEAQRIDAWHGSISGTFASKITALFSNPIGAPDASHTRTYLGFQNGSVAWFDNTCVPNPNFCTHYTFCTEDGELYLPKWNGLFKADAKLLHSYAIESPDLSPLQFAQLEYQKSPVTGIWSVLGQASSPPLTTLVFDGETWGTEVALRLVLKTIGAGIGKSPTITAQALRHSVRPALVLLYEFYVNAADGQTKRDGSLLRLDAPTIRDLVKAVASDPASTQFTLADEVLQNLSQIDYGEALGWDERLYAWTAAIHCKAVQVKLNTTTGNVARLGPYRVQDLAPFTVQQLGVL